MRTATGKHYWVFMAASAGLHIFLAVWLLSFGLKINHTLEQPSLLKVHLVSSLSAPSAPPGSFPHSSISSASPSKKAETGSRTIQPAKDLPLRESYTGIPTAALSSAPLSEAPLSSLDVPAEPGRTDAAGVSDTTEAPATAGEEEEDEFRREVKNRLERAKRYPWPARILGQEGTVRLRFVIDSLGTAKEIHLVESSGSRILDEEAVKTVKRVGTFPRPPSATQNGKTIQVPLVFKLETP